MLALQQLASEPWNNYITSLDFSVLIYNGHNIPISQSFNKVSLIIVTTTSINTRYVPGTVLK